MSNRIHLEDVLTVNPSVLTELPIDQLEMLLVEADQEVYNAKKKLDVLNGVVGIKFQGKAAEARKAAGKDTGTVRLVEGDYEVAANLPKRVEWDQVALHSALDALPVEIAFPIVSVKLSIDERAYEALAPEHKAILLPARTVKTGKPTYSLKPLAEV